jgi:hypothetical protein
VVAFDVKDGLLPTIDASAMKLSFGGLDALGIADFVTLQLRVLKPMGQLGALGQLQVEHGLADTLLLDGGMGVAAVYQVFDDTLEESVREFALGSEDGGLRVGGRLGHTQLSL